MGRQWAEEAVFYHIYPLGLCGAPRHADPTASPVARLDEVHSWIPHLEELGVNALYIGPLFESSSHGYDTVDYCNVDRRLGTNDTLTKLCDELHSKGIRVVLDGVFHHVGRDFWAFRDVVEKGQASPYCGWFDGLRFDGCSPYGDSFRYEGWRGDLSLVKLDTDHPAVRAHLLGAVTSWIQSFDIDGLRLDVADCLDRGFQQKLAAHCRSLKPDFWIMGEVVHGDYRDWLGPEGIDSVTNYEAHKGLYSSLVDRNCFEIAHSLDRQFTQRGLYRDMALYNFVDNHDVTRVASRFDDSALLYPLYGLLFTIPGIPSIYYGSEWGVFGEKGPDDDGPLRPALSLDDAVYAPQADLAKTIKRFTELRHGHVALRKGSFRNLHIASEQLAFAREYVEEEENLLIVLNIAPASAKVDLDLKGLTGETFEDLLNEGDRFIGEGGRLQVDVPPRWLRILQAT